MSMSPQKITIFWSQKKSIFSIHVLGRLDSWGLTWSEVEELRYEIQLLNLDVKLWEYFSTLERQDAFEDDLEQFIVM